MPNEITVNGSVEVIVVDDQNVQVITAGAQGPPGPSGGPVNVTTISANYTATDTDNVILVNATSGEITVTLTDPEEGKQITVKKIDSTTNLVIVEGPGDVQIDDGWAEITRYGLGMQFTADGTQWWVTGVVAVTG